MSWSCDIDDGPTVYSWKEVVARKEHLCCECGGKIPTGEKYFKAQGLWEGKWSTYCQHLICMKACMYIRDTLNGFECIAFGGLMEWYDDTRRWLNEHKKDAEVIPIRKMLAQIL